mgnify:CR=1 FL=1
MANKDATDLLTKQKHMGQYGDAVIAYGQVTVASTADNDVIRPCVIPAGTMVHAILIGNGDFDTGTPEIVCNVGYSPVNSTDGPAESAAYFAPAGQTILQSLNEGKLFCNFAPIKFEYDVYLIVTVPTDSATDASATLYATVLGRGVGIQ